MKYEFASDETWKSFTLREIQSDKRAGKALK